MTLREQIGALSDDQLRRLFQILDTIQDRLRAGMSFAGEFNALSYEFSFSDADLLDTKSLMTVATQEAEKRGMER